MTSSSTEPTVFVVDDDPAVQQALSRLLRSAGLRVETFASCEAFLARDDPQAPRCLLLDVVLPGPGGLALQRLLRGAGLEAEAFASGAEFLVQVMFPK